MAKPKLPPIPIRAPVAVDLNVALNLAADPAPTSPAPVDPAPVDPAPGPGAVEPSSPADPAPARSVEIPEGFAAVDHDDPAASLTFDGKTHARDEAGLMVVPLAGLGLMKAFGFRQALVKPAETLTN